MAFPNYQQEGLEIKLCHTGVMGASTTAIGGTVSLSARGFRIVNPFDLGFNLGGVSVPNKAGLLFAGDMKQRSKDIIIQGVYHASPGDDQEDFRATLWGGQAFQDLSEMAEESFETKSYLSLGFWDGAAYQTFKKHGKVADVSVTQPPHMEGLAYLCQIVFRPNDPRWYNATEESETIVVTSGSGTSGVVLSGGVFNVERMAIVVKRTGGTNPTNVVIADAIAGWSLRCVGSLTTSNAFWWIDAGHGKCYKGAGSLTNGVEDATFLDGPYPWILAPAFNVSVTDGGTASFEVYVYWNERHL